MLCEFINCDRATPIKRLMLHPALITKRLVAELNVTPITAH